MVYLSTRHSLPAPTDADPVASYASIARSLVDKLDLDVVGALVTATTGFVAQAGWSTPVIRARKVLDGLAWLDLTVTRTGATLTASANGGLTDTDMLQVPAAYTPARAQLFPLHRNTAQMWQGRLTSAGMLQVVSGYPTATIVATETVSFQGLVELV